jgi:hypothetical protein
VKADEIFVRVRAISLNRAGLSGLVDITRFREHISTSNAFQSASSNVGIRAVGSDF